MRSLSFSRPDRKKPPQPESISPANAALDLASAPAADSPALVRPSVTPVAPSGKALTKASPRTSWMARNLSFRNSKKQLGTPGEAETPQVTPQAMTLASAMAPSPPISLPPTAFPASAQLRSPASSHKSRAASVELVAATPVSAADRAGTSCYGLRLAVS